MLDGSLELGPMQEAVKHFIGEHDFRNFCKVHPRKLTPDTHHEPASAL